MADESAERSPDTECALTLLVRDATRRIPERQSACRGVAR